MYKKLLVIVMGLFVLLIYSSTYGTEVEVTTLKQQLEELRKDLIDKQKKVEALEKRLEAMEKTSKPSTTVVPTTSPTSALDQAVLESASTTTTATPAHTAHSPTSPIGGAEAKLIDISLNTLFTAGCSSIKGENLELLQGGGEDPKRCGFTLQQAELSLAGAVDPYFNAEAHIVFTDEHVELEEVFFKSIALPVGLQLKGGYFLTEFGRINPTHADDWHWTDQTIINNRLFGGDGLHSVGVRLSWLLPTAWYSEALFSVQNANSETAVSFLGNRESPSTQFNNIGGRPTFTREVGKWRDLLYLVRWENAGNFFNDTLTTKWGVSALFGPNNGGNNTKTRIYGTDLVMKWKPQNNFRGWPFVIWETELMEREYQVAAFKNEEVDLTADTLNDWGLYTQALYGFRPQWAVGLRYEYANGNKESVGGRAADPFCGKRQRISPLLTYYSSEFSRLRLQYNYDDADFLSKKGHSLWLSFEFLLGQHPAHKF